MTFLFWVAVIPAVVWGLLWAVTEIIRAWTTPDRFDDVDDLLRRNR